MERVLAGRYELEVPLGRGGSGEVWRGRDLATRRPVAIKLVELSLIDDPGLLAETIGRFRREAEVVGGLRHPNIVGSLDAGRIGNQLFMIMELAPGISLASMMDERGARGMGLFPVSSVLRIAEQVCAGLAAAHATGVVHRDIKPSNLMVTPQLGIKIIDFGIARLLADNSPRLTMRGHTVGTIAYMSPEQAQGDDVDARSDLYSLGCVLYQLLSGRLPFRSSMPGALLMMQVMDQAIPLSSIRPDLPAGLPELVSDLMEKDRGARPSSAVEVMNRIAAIGGRGLGDMPQHEADRQTVQAGDPSGGFGDPSGGFGDPRLQQLPPESGRSTVLTPERLAGLSGADPYGPGLPGPGLSDPGFSDSRFSAAGPSGRDTAAVPPWELQQSSPTAPVMQSQQPWTMPPQSAPPQVRGNSGGMTPAWPVPPQRRRRRRWGGVISTLLTLAIAAGVWYYVWDQKHSKLQITDQVTVAATNEKVGCNGTTVIVGTIPTNGRAGEIDYRWEVTGQTPKTLVADNASGSKTLQVRLKWTFHGKGTGTAEATLHVLTPSDAKGSIEFPYSCPK
jgi:serine/threonine-protein kinase